MSRPSAILTASLVAALLSLPACGKKKDTPPDSTPPSDYSGSKQGPPNGLPGPSGPGQPNTGQPNAGQPNDPSLPARPQPLGLTDAVSRQTSRNNLLQIGLAFHNIHDVSNSFPIGIADKSGKIGLSWRVAILPYIEQDTLYKQFKLDEPWDSEHNKKLIKMMPKIYAPSRNSETNGYTYYRSFSGPDAIMPPAARPGQPGQVVPGVSIAGIPDGSSNTLLVAEAAEPVIWTKPEELPYDKSKAPPKLGGGAFKDGFTAVLCDGSTRFIKSTISPADLGNAINRQDGNVVNFDN